MAIAIAIAALAMPAFAQSPDALRKAQASFDQAQSDYLQGKYDEAAQGFQEAYSARPFPQFLYNVGASFHMKGKKTSDVPSYTKAVEFYKRYLKEEPNATDKPKVEKAIGVLEAEIKRLQDLASGAGSAAGSGSAAPQAAPSAEVQSLGDVKVRGLVVIVTEPQNATIYLDDKKKGAFAQTPWSGSIEGEHKLIIEKQGYKPVETVISADPTKLIQVISPLSQEFHLGWIKITSNVPGADIFIDDKSVGAVAKTPLSPGQNIEPGKHTVWISAEGFDEYSETVEIFPGKSKEIHAMLKGSPVGKLTVSGMGIEESQVLIDGQVACPTGPCLKSVPEGSHEITVKRSGYKTYSRKIVITPKTETTVKVQQAPKPGRGDAVVAYVLTAAFGGGAIYLGTQSKNIKSELQKDIDAGMPPVDNNDPRFLRGKVYAIAADGCFAIAGITFLTAIYYTLRDKGPPTRAQIDVHALALQPQVGATYAGLGLGGSF
ncbi:MAG TPA: PEGA domain-containing protein [Kofleriaceae bacterium]